MNNLQILNQQKTINSREVAEMMGKNHWQVLRDIEGSNDGKTVGIIKVLNDHKLGVVNYFIESSYTDRKGERRKFNS